MATDGNKIASYMKDAASNLRSEGRKAVYAIIATAWTISFTDGKFTPTNNILWSLGLALTYLLLDLLYFLISSSLYKYLLFKYFKPKKDGEFQYTNKTEREGEKVANITKSWNHIGQLWILIMSLLLLTSFLFMLLVIFSLSTNGIQQP